MSHAQKHVLRKESITLTWEEKQNIYIAVFTKLSGRHSWKSESHLLLFCWMKMIPPKGISCDFSWRTNCCDLNPGQKAGTAPLGRLKQSQVALQSITFINHGSFSPFRWGSPAHHGRMFWRRRTKVIFCNYQLLWPVPLLMSFIYKTMEKKKACQQMGWNITWEAAGAALQHHYGSVCIYQRQHHWLAAAHAKQVN